jgi:hypothetical protein
MNWEAAIHDLPLSKPLFYLPSQALSPHHGSSETEGYSQIHFKIKQNKMLLSIIFIFFITNQSSKVNVNHIFQKFQGKLLNYSASAGSVRVGLHYTNK